jgi:type IV pilus assembly protein PilN
MSAVGMQGFNLLPYRSGARRRTRNRTVAMLAGAGLAGCAAVGVVAGWDALERVHFDRQREAAETQLRALRIPAAEHAKLTEDEALRRRAQAVAAPLAEPRARFLGLLDALGLASSKGSVALQRVTQRAHEVELGASAPDSHAAAAWLKALESVRGVRAVEIVEMRRRVSSAAAPVPGGASKPGAKARPALQGAGAYDFVAVVRWAEGPGTAHVPARLIRAGKPDAAQATKPGAHR